MRNEKVFQSEIRSALRTLSGVKFYFKVPDLGAQNPFDAILVYNSMTIALEYKISKNTISIPLWQLFSGRDHEISALRRVKLAGGYGYILLNIFDAHKINTVYIIDVDDYVALMNEILPAKSIKLSDNRLKKFTQMVKVKNNYDRIWDLNQIIGEITYLKK